LRLCVGFDSDSSHFHESNEGVHDLLHFDINGIVDARVFVNVNRMERIRKCQPFIKEHVC
jgi:hypothetical protein